MKKLTISFLICLLTMGMTLSIQAQPRVGTWISPDNFPAGDWREKLWGGSEGAQGNEIEAESDGIYIFDGAILDYTTVDEDGTDYTKYITEYTGGTVELFNDPSVPWHNSNDPSGSFIAALGITTNQTWKYDDDTMAFELTVTGGFQNHPGYRAMITARYNRNLPGFSDSGNPDEPDIIFGELSWAKITITGPLAVDIKPCSCPNPVNTKSNGVLPVAILGTPSFDVNSIDPESVELAGVKALRWSWEDVSTPSEPLIGKQGANDCSEDGPDGFMDLTLKFDTQEILNTLGSVNDGDELILELTADLVDGTSLIGEDVIIIRHKEGKGKKANAVQVCKSRKLKAAARLCNTLMACCMRGTVIPDGGGPCTERAKIKFEADWGKAEAYAAKKELDCSTGSMESIEELILYGVEDICGQIRAGVDPDDPKGAHMAKRLLKTASMKCRTLFKAESVNADNPDEKKKTATKNKAEEKFQKKWIKQMAFEEKHQLGYNGPSMDELGEMIDDLVEDVMAAMDSQ